MFKYFIISLLLISTCVQNGKTEDLNLKAYSVMEGLAQSQVYTVVQDLDGYLWVGTGAGLSRFDGNSFTNFHYQQGLAGNIISSSFRDENGDLWFGCYSGKLNKYDWATKTISTLTILDSSAFFISKIIRDKKGNLWVGTESKGLFCLIDGKLRRFTKDDGLNSNFVYDIDILNDGFLLVSFDSGLKKIRYDDKNDSLEIKNILGLDFLDDVIINSVVLDETNGDVWVATATEGLIRFNQNREAAPQIIRYGLKEGLPDIDISQVMIDNNSQIWISVSDKGILVADIRESMKNLKIIKFYRKEYDLDKSLVFAFYNDSEGNVWIGTDGAGLVEYQNLAVHITAYYEDFKNLSIWAIQEGRDDKKMWFGLEKRIAYASVNDRGLGKVEYISLTYEGSKGLQQVTRLFEDRYGDLYFISWKNGLFKLNKRKNEIVKYIPYADFPQEYINSFLIDKEVWWFVTEGMGVIRYNRKTGEKKEYDFSAENPHLNYIYDLYKDREGNIWFGTYAAGVIKYDGEKFHFLNKNNGFPMESCISFTEDVFGNMWFVSYDGEIIRFDGKKYENFSFSQGIEGRPVYSVMSSDSAIWIGTTNGIVCYNVSDSTFTDYNTKSGFKVYETNQGAVYLDSGGGIWFGTIKGVVKLEITDCEQRKNIKQIPLYIDKIQVFFKDTPLPKDNKFDYDKNYLTFHYQAINLTNPLRVRYSFKLEGYDENWSPPFRENKVTYSNLPPGNYIFKVRANNGDSSWGNESTDYYFEIKAPFWKTRLFYLLIIIIVSAFVVFFYKRRIFKLEKNNRILEEEVQKRIAEVSNEKEKVEYALKALRESEKKFRVFTETTSSTIFIIKNGRVDYINPAGEKLTGYSKQKLMSFNILNLIHKDFVEEVKDYLSNDDRYEFLDNLTLKIINRSGVEKWIEVIVKSITYDGERVFLGTAVDITSRKRVEERLLEEKERLTVTLGSITDAVVTTDISGKIILMNTVAEKISGVSNNEVVGKKLNSIFQLKDKNSNKNIQNLIETSLKNAHKKSVEEEVTLTNQSGEKLFIEYTSSVIRDGRSEITGIVFVFRDITERKKIFDELLKTKKLESLGVLAGGIAHDFNNILTAVIGNLSLAKMKIDPKNVAYKWVDLSEKSSMRAKNLTQQLLTFSKGGAPVKKNAAIDKLIEETTAFILSGSNVDCITRFDDHLPHVSMDQGQISQVIQNLIINAQNAMPYGGTIDIDVTSLELNSDSKLSIAQGSYVRIKIQDSGAGISKEHIDKVFDPFYTTTKTGSGLGLSTAYSIIKNHNGSITVDSAVGIGTTFTIYLPAAVANDTEDKEVVDSGFKGSGNILLMDDEQLVLDTTAALLEFMGFTVTKVKDGEKAIQVYKERLTDNPFSAVIMDLTIPGGMGGKESVGEILKIDPQAFVVVSSGYSSDPVMSEYKKYGFRGRIKKPYNYEEMGLLLKSLGLV